MAWDDEREDWVEVWLMKVARAGHAVSIVDIQELVGYCSCDSVQASWQIVLVVGLFYLK